MNTSLTVHSPHICCGSICFTTTQPIPMIHTMSLFHVFHYYNVQILHLSDLVHNRTLFIHVKSNTAQTAIYHSKAINGIGCREIMLFLCTPSPKKKGGGGQLHPYTSYWHLCLLITSCHRHK